MLARTEPRTGRHRRDRTRARSAPVPAGQQVSLPPRRTAATSPGTAIRPPARGQAADRERHRAAKFTWRRVLAATGALACAVTLFSVVTGSTFGRFRASETSGTNSFAAGTVTLASSAIAHCPVTSLLPSSTASAPPCAFTATYSGSAPVYLAVNVLIEAQAGAGGTKLYNPTDASNDLSVTITSASPPVSYTNPTTATTCPGSAPPGSACYELDNELVSTSAVSSAAVAFSVAVNIPAGSATGYQGGAAQIILATHAVQSKNNTLSCTATPAAGSPCTPSGSFRWS